jgi:hypothetical protein
MPAAHFELRAVVQDKNVVPTRRRAACIDPIKVDYRAAMNAVEFLRIEVLLDAFHSRPSSVDHAGRVNLNIIGSRGEIVDLIDRGITVPLLKWMTSFVEYPTESSVLAAPFARLARFRRLTFFMS